MFVVDSDDGDDGDDDADAVYSVSQQWFVTRMAMTW